MPGRQVVLLTDFGLKDGSSRVLEAVIDRINPNAKTTHFSHLVEPFDVQEGAFLLVANYWHFPPGTIFAAIVDPGVGTERKMLLVETDNYSFLGPDNGILWPVIEAEGFRRIIALDKNEVRKNAFATSCDAYFKRPASTVFEGRDYIAPAAGLISMLPPGRWGMLGRDCGKEKLKNLRFALNRREEDIAIGRVVFVDSFGNLVIGCTRKDFERFVGDGEFEISFSGGKDRIRRLSQSYSDGSDGEPMALFGGDFEHPTEGSFLEIAVKEDNASQRLGVAKYDDIVIKRR